MGYEIPLEAKRLRKASIFINLLSKKTLEKGRTTEVQLYMELSKDK